MTMDTLRFRIIFRQHHKTLGPIAVVVVDDDRYPSVLDCDFFVGTMKSGVFYPLPHEHKEIADACALQATIHYLVQGAEIVSSEHAPGFLNVEGEESDEWFLETEKYGPVIVGFLSTVVYRDVTYDIFAAKAEPPKHLIVILERISVANDDEWFYYEVDVTDAKLCRAILRRLQIEEGVIKPRPEDFMLPKVRA